MPKVRCGECKETWEQPRGVLLAATYERHRPGCNSAPTPDPDEPEGNFFLGPPDPYTSIGGTP